MPAGLIVLVLVTLPLAAVMTVIGLRLRARTEPLARIRTPGGGLIDDPAERLRATHRIGLAALTLAVALVVLTGVMVWQDRTAGRMGPPEEEDGR